MCQIEKEENKKQNIEIVYVITTNRKGKGTTLTFVIHNKHVLTGVLDMLLMIKLFM